MPQRAPSSDPGPSRGRPRDFDPDAVLAAAVDVFWQKGYQAATTRELEAATGLSQSSLYNAFGSKWGLLEEALGRYEQETSVQLLGPLESSADGLDAVNRFFDDLAAWVSGGERPGCLIINLMVEDGGTTPELRTRVEAYRQSARSAFLTALQRARSTGELTPGPLEPRADVLVGLVMGLDVAARGRCSSGELDALVHSIHALIDGWRVS